MSDVAAEVAGSVGCAASANIGDKYAMFEAVHGSAPDIAGQGIANPSALINASVMMLNHVGDGNTARVVKNAWLKTIEDGFFTVLPFAIRSSVGFPLRYTDLNAYFRFLGRYARH